VRKPGTTFQTVGRRPVSLRDMTLGLSIVLFAAGLIMRFAVTATNEDFNFDAGGNALIVIGIVGIVIGTVEQFLARTPAR